jgi:hypothetical protein
MGGSPAGLLGRGRNKGEGLQLQGTGPRSRVLSKKGDNTKQVAVRVRNAIITRCIDCWKGSEGSEGCGRCGVLFAT